ncbi:FLZ-type domain-containing protein [Psidium guajava]|nr:FLZ-type domain-containing protein [Psidium guajava]
MENPMSREVRVWENSALIEDCRSQAQHDLETVFLQPRSGGSRRLVHK